MAKNTANKKENPLVGPIIMIVAGLIAAIFGGDYLWVLFGAIEIPLPIVGVVFLVLGVIFLLVALKNKKTQKPVPEVPNQQ